MRVAARTVDVRREPARRLSKGATAMDANHKKYDNPESADEKSGKAVMFVVGALAVALVLFLLATGRVEILH
jgi:hypothetical protein